MKKRMLNKSKTLSYALIFTFLTVTFASWGQNINTPMPTVPFGSNKGGYPFGTLPTNLPTSGTYGNSQACASYYTTWVNNWMETCNDGTRYVRWDGGSPVVSEGVAYGMIIAAYMGDKELLDDLWAFYKKHMNENGLMDWEVSCTSVIKAGAASDAEMDAAMALIIAEYQWPDINSPYDYQVEAEELIADIEQYEINAVNPGRYQLMPGDKWFDEGAVVRNPGYVAIGYMKCFAETSKNNTDWWNQLVIPANYELLLSNIHPTTGLGSDWCDQNGDPSGSRNFDFRDDASRIPWRIGVDAMWFGDDRSVEICNDLAEFLDSKGGAGKVGGRFKIDGSNAPGDIDLIFISMYAVGVMGANPDEVNLSSGKTLQELVNGYYNVTKGTNSDYYFPAILKMISMICITGNFWKPGQVAGCTKVDLGSDMSICGSSSLTLNTGFPNGQNKEFTWYKGSTVVKGPSSTATSLNVTSAGTYTVEIDSANGECVVSDELTVLGTLPTVNLGADVELCVPAMATLDAGVSGNGINYAWEKDGSPLNEDEQTLVVAEEGTYKVTISATGCSSKTDQVTVTSLLPETEGGMTCDPGVVTLEVLSTGGPYEWYSAASGGSALATGNTYSPSITKTTTFYVEDAGTINTSIGVDADNHPLTGAQNAGDISLDFTAHSGFSITGVTVAPFVYHCDENNAVSIQLDLKSGGSIVASSSVATVPCNAAQTTAPFELYTLVFDDPLVIASAGDYTLDYSQSKSDLAWYDGGADFSALSFDGIATFTGDSRGDKTNSHPGIFDLQVSTGNSCDRAPVVAELTCGVGTEESMDIEIAVFPNPTKNSVSISLEKSLSGTVELRDQSGLLMSQSHFKGSDHLDLSLEGLAKGLYFVFIITEEGSLTKPVIKE